MKKHQAKQVKATHVQLPGSQRFLRAGSQVLGRCDAQEWCEITVKVRRKTPLPEPVPDRPISRAVLLSKYGAEPKELDLVEKELTALGLTVKARNDAARCLYVAGTVSAMEVAFGVNLFQVKHGDLVYRGRTRSINIPARLDGIVTGVFGLDNRPMVRRGRRPSLQSSGGAVPPATHRPWFFPRELAAAYQFPAGDGAGQVVAILEFGGDFVASYLQQFWPLGGTPGPVPTVNVSEVQQIPGRIKNDPDFTGETMLDVEVVAAVCPRATLQVYFSNWSDQGWIANLDAALHDNPAPSVVSISYSLAEGTDIWTQQGIGHINDTLKEFANAGITVCVSSGDDGSDDQVGDGAAHVGFPASSPYVLAVGGTSLHRHTGAETVWHEGNGVRPYGGSTGGGVSEMNPRPAWQNLNIPSANPHAPQGRILPDVSGNAALSTGYRVYGPSSDPNLPPGSAGWQTIGGTSASTPLWAALIALLQQAGKNVGFLTPRLYQANAKTGGKPLGSVACRDITRGRNSSGSANGYSAAVGFDAATGWGSPNGAKLAANLP